MTSYALIIFPGMESSILRLTDYTFIAKDENSRTYKEYLEWLADGNVPEERAFDAD